MFEKPIDRNINGVIKVGQKDEENNTPGTRRICSHKTITKTFQRVLRELF